MNLGVSRRVASATAALTISLGTIVMTVQSVATQISSNANLTPEQRLELGASDYQTYCAACHGSGGLGNGPVAIELVKKPANLTKLTKNAGGTYPAEEIKKQIDGREMPLSHGNSKMPVWGQWFSVAANVAGVLQDDVPTAEAVVKARIERLTDYLNTIQE